MVDVSMDTVYGLLRRGAWRSPSEERIWKSVQGSSGPDFDQWLLEMREPARAGEEFRRKSHLFLKHR